MLTDQELITIPDPIQRHFRRLERMIVRTIADHIRHIGTVEQSHLHRLSELQRVGFNINKIEREVARTLNIAERDVHTVLLAASRKEYNGVRQFAHLYNTTLVPFNENAALKSLVEQIGASTGNTFRNLSHTSANGLVDRTGRVRHLRQYYYDQIDWAVMQAALGQDDWQALTRSTIRHLADGGFRQVNWASGWSQRVDTSVRRNVLWGLGELSRQQADMIAHEINADGMEITWHDGYRPSHNFGGQQFRMAIYRGEIRNQLEEPNCYHRAFPIVMGVSTPSYTPSELAHKKDLNEKVFEFDGEPFTRYTAEQRQRRYETSIRKAQDRVFAFDASGDRKAVQIERTRMNQLLREYSRFSYGIGSKPFLNRIAV